MDLAIKILIGIIILLCLILILILYKKATNNSINKLLNKRRRIFNHVRIDNIDISDIINNLDRIIEPEPVKKTDHFNNLIKHNNDPQNVHDPKIIAYLSKKYARLKQLANNAELAKEVNLPIEDIKNIKTGETIYQISNLASKLDPKKKKAFDKAFEKIMKNSDIISISNELDSNSNLVPVKELDVLTLVWERINHADNKNNFDSLQAALLDQIQDCIQSSQIIIDLHTGERDTYVVCTNGRVARLLSALTLLDADPILSEPEKDLDEIANEAYSKAANILKQELSDPNIYQLYIADKNELSAKDTLLIKAKEENIKDKIKSTLRKDYENILNNRELNEIINNALEGV